MAGRIRTIKPELLEDAVTAGLSDTAFRLFVGCILLADDYGNLRGETSFLSAQVYWRVSPSQDVALAFDEICVRLVTRYDVNGQTYLHINGWDKHQKISKKGNPRVPSYGGSGGQDSALPPTSPNFPQLPRADLRSTINDQRSSISNSDETRSTVRTPAWTDDTNVPAPIKSGRKNIESSRIDAGWNPAPNLIEYGKTLGVDAVKMRDDFVDHWLSSAKPEAVKRDWDAAFRLWIRNGIKFGKYAKYEPPPREVPPGTPLFDDLGKDQATEEQVSDLFSLIDRINSGTDE